jgi:hypothetical protein
MTRQTIGVPSTKFVVGIPTLKRYDLLDQCIESIWTSSVTPEQIIVIDNGRGYIAKYDKVVVIKPYRNLGVAGSWNLLHILSDPVELILCNDDLRLSHYVLEMLLSIDQPVVTAASWSCFRQKHEVWRIVGDYDENFWPAYHEDNDYAYRLRLAGMNRVEVAHDGIWHYGSATIHSFNADEAAHFQYCWEQCREYYRRKWGGLPDQERFTKPFNSDHAAIVPVTVGQVRAGYYARACTNPSDIWEHVPVLNKYGKLCQHITEFGVGHGNSTIAFLHAQPHKLVCYELNVLPEVGMMRSLAEKTQFLVHQEDTTKAEIEETDLLFIDTRHVYEQMKAELRNAWKVRKFIITHDSVTFGERGEDGGPGILPAINELLAKETFAVREAFSNNNGLLVLGRINVSRDP